MKTLSKLTILIFVILLFQSCKQNQNNLFEDFENDFTQSIKKSQAVLFEYQYDGLMPQSSYFVDCKLKYLILRESGELSTSIKLIEFENDSIIKIVEHFTTYEGNDNGRTAGRDLNKLRGDTIYSLDYKTQKYEIYTNNKLLKSTNLKIIRNNTNYTYKIKQYTEDSYNRH